MNYRWFTTMEVTQAKGHVVQYGELRLQGDTSLVVIFHKWFEAGIHQFHHHIREVCLLGGEIHAQELHNIRVANSVTLDAFLDKAIFDRLLLLRRDPIEEERVDLFSGTNQPQMLHGEHFAIGASSQLLSSWFNSFESKTLSVARSNLGKPFCAASQKEGWAGYSNI